jgi:hypothetical protein
VDWSGRHLTLTGIRGKVEAPQEQMTRRLDFLPAESKCLERKETVDDNFSFPDKKNKNIKIFKRIYKNT